MKHTSKMFQMKRSNESNHYELNDYDRQRQRQTLIDDDRIQRVSLDLIIKNLSVNENDLTFLESNQLFSVRFVSIYFNKRW